MSATRRLWLFDLDNTLHDASHAAFGGINGAMTDYIVRAAGDRRRRGRRAAAHYWLRYGATLLGLVRHHGVQGRPFPASHASAAGPGGAPCAATPHDIAALRALRGRKFILTNAPRAYTERVLGVLGIARCFDGVIAIEDMRMFGELRPKPDARMLRRLRRG